jgi:hypothetical protein
LVITGTEDITSPPANSLTIAEKIAGVSAFFKFFIIK